MDHFTKKFKEAYEEVLLVAETEGEQRGKLAFRDAMLKLGHDERVKNLYRVQDKLSKHATFFKMNKPQAEYIETKGKRNIILKCRQVGFTTLNCIRALDYALWEANSRSGILCHKLSTVKTIFNDITKFCYNWFLRDWGHLYKPEHKMDSASTLSFKNDGLGRPLESSILVLFDFRGKTTHFLHVAEASRIPIDRLIGSLNGVPDNGEVTFESTAHGRAGEFHRLWALSRGKNKAAPFKGFFIPWFDYYPEDLDNWDFPEEGKWTNHEYQLMKDYPGKITKAHLLWRRFCIEAKCAGDEETFENEYPTNDIDCFLTGEASVFPSSILKMHDRNTRDPFFTGFLLANGKSIDMHEDSKGCIAIWEKPDPAVTYVIGADPSGGVGRDKAAAYVKNQKTGKFVARLWGDLIPADFAKELYKLAQFYNKAWTCVEANNHGHLVLHVLKEMGFHHLYKRQAVDELTKRPTKKVGFLTGKDNKITVTEKFKSAAKDNTVIILDKELISEMSSFMQIAGKTGSAVRREASAGAHDDLVMAASFTEEMCSSRKITDTDEYEHYSKAPTEVVVDPDTGFVIGEYDNAR